MIKNKSMFCCSSVPLLHPQLPVARRYYPIQNDLLEWLFIPEEHIYIRYLFSHTYPYDPTTDYEPIYEHVYLIYHPASATVSIHGFESGRPIIERIYYGEDLGRVPRTKDRNRLIDYATKNFLET